tara:strand:+ start:20788 stop:21720 length:933 start_codon:yes stop_codon:yes gene_type:complete
MSVGGSYENFDSLLELPGIGGSSNKSKNNNMSEVSEFDSPLMAGAMAAGGIGQAVGGVVDLVQGFKARGRAEDALSDAEENLAKLMDSQPSLSTPSEYYDAVKNAYDQRLVQMRTADINRSLATTAQAAQQFGSRGLGAVMQATTQAQDQMRQEALAQNQLQTQALTNLAAARERETQLRERRSERDIEYGFDAQALAQAQLAQARQQIGSGFANVAGGVASGVIGIASMSGDKGLKVKKTPGKFDHDTNEMYVVDSDGNPVGIALTGGEYVIDPARAKRLKNKSKDSSLKGMKVLRREVRKMVKDFEES